MGFLIGFIGLILLWLAIGQVNFAVKSKEQNEKKEQELEFLKNSLEKREYFIEKKENTINDLDQKISESTSSLFSLNEQLTCLIEEIDNAYDASLISVYPSTIISNIDVTSSAEIKNNLSLLKLKEKEIILNEGISHPYYFSNKEISSFKKKMIFPLDSEVAGLLNKLTLANIDSTRNRILKTFEKINRLFNDDKVQMSNKLLEIKLQELELNYSFIIKTNDEKEQQKAIKEQIVEEEKVRREIDREKKRIDKEEKQFNSEITKLFSYLQKTNTDVEKELYANKIKELEDKLKELQIIKNDVINRELNTRAGYVYIISNIGSFGENIYKIGVTRRLEPMDRIKELSSASVPFEFDVHAMIFSDDAPTLENQLHNHFRCKEVNKVNSRKEFFKVAIEEIEKVVIENYNGTVVFTKVAEAEQFRRSLELASTVI